MQEAIFKVNTVKEVANIYIYIYIYIFQYGFSFTTIHEPQDCKGRGRAFLLAPHYHFHPLHRHLDTSRAITADSSLLHRGSRAITADSSLLHRGSRAITALLHRGSSRTQTGNLWFRSAIH